MDRNLLMEIDRIALGQKAAVAKALNLVENRSPALSPIVRELTETMAARARHQRHCIGISGPPGVGKSSMISWMITKYRSLDRTVGVLSVDPSSSRSGGALLGDRIRISYDSNDPGIFIRSMAAGDHLGGLSWNTRLNLTVFEAAYDTIIIESVGVGQSETEIEHAADTVVVVVQPGSGDLMQFIKAGIMEIPHILVVNKADQKDLAKKTFQDLTQAMMTDNLDRNGWDMRIVMTSSKTGAGFEELIGLLQEHRAFLEHNGIVGKRRKDLFWWISACFRDRFGTFGVESLGGQEKIFSLLDQAGVISPQGGVALLEEIMAMRSRASDGTNTA